MLAHPPDLVLATGKPAYSPRQAAAVLNVTPVTVKRAFDAGELVGEKVPSRGKKEYYAIYPESLEAFAAQRTARAHRALHTTLVPPAAQDDTIALLHTAQTNARIHELETLVARLEERLAEAQHREQRLHEVIRQQSLQLQSFIAAQSSMLDQLR